MTCVHRLGCGCWLVLWTRCLGYYQGTGWFCPGVMVSLGRVWPGQRPIDITNAFLMLHTSIWPFWSDGGFSPVLPPDRGEQVKIKQFARIKRPGC
ncbi:hypothetical protein V8C44DRAFT_344757 [Trichoderma aethiopicum]